MTPRSGPSARCAALARTCSTPPAVQVIVESETGRWSARYCERHGSAVAEANRGPGRTVTVKRLVTS